MGLFGAILANPIAIASATIPSMRPVDLILSNFRFAAGSVRILAMHSQNLIGTESLTILVLDE